MAINTVVLVGRLTRDPDSRTTPTGKSVANFTVAVDRRVKSEEQSADFFNVVAWGQTADFVSKYLGKGRLVAVEGRLQQRKYTTQEGHVRDVVEVVANSVQGLDRPRDDHGGSPSPSQSQAPDEDEYDPFSE